MVDVTWCWRPACRRRLRWVGIALMLNACSLSGMLRQDTVRIERELATARERGAYRCAAQALARAEEQLNLMHHALDQGDDARARSHHDAASAAADLAVARSDPAVCLEGGGPDRDADGVADMVDECPDEPEDHDQFEDTNGCPDPDNDGDSVLDVVDRCPDRPGRPQDNGCPAADRDGDGIADVADRCPDAPEDRDGIADDDGCPEERSGDFDGDGVVDDADRCIAEPEDKDLFQDEDGCPDPDNDGDTILDMVDACPLQPGSAANHGCPVVDRDGDGINDGSDSCPDIPGRFSGGCPRRVLVVKTETRIGIQEPIKFAANAATIRGDLSYEVIAQVGSVMKSNPQIKVAIESHTDSVGPADDNLRLSDRRARAVLLALVAQGIARERLEAIGYGESRPIASNKTRAGRAANQRVEFLIVSR